MKARSPSLSLVLTLACLCAVISVGCADRATPPQASAPSATIVAVEGASTTYHTRDWNGKRVSVRVRTAEGQMIVLAMAPEALAGLKAGDHIVFTKPGVPRP